MIASHDVVEGGLFLILPALLEGGEVMLDGIEVWRIGCEKQQGRASGRDELRRFGCGMKCGVVHDHEMVGVQTRAQPRLQPGVEDSRIAGAVEQ